MLIEHKAVQEPDSAGDEQLQMAFARGLKLLATREHSAAELRRKLRVKGFSEALAGDAVAALQDQGLQSDRRFAEVFVRSRLSKGYGPVRIRRDLYQRGIGDDVIDEELTFPAERWVELATAVRAKRFPESEPTEHGVWNVQARFLSRKGFPADIIYRVLGQV
jgi:regulatory protein